MDFLERIEASLPTEIDFAHLKSFCPQDCWNINPVQASVIALESSGFFDKVDYLYRYPDVAASGMDPLYHFLNHGIYEKRIFKRTRSRHIFSDARTIDSYQHLVAMPTYSVIIKMSANSSDIIHQYRALMGQTRSPVELIYLRHSDSPSQKAIRNATSQDIKILDMNPDSPATLLHAAGLASGEYLAIMDADVIPGNLWIANAIRASSGYSALVTANGFLATSHDGKRTFLPVSSTVDTYDNLSCATRDAFCDWGNRSLLLRREWLSKLGFNDFDTTMGNISAQLAYFLYMRLGIKSVVPMQPEYEIQLHGDIMHRANVVHDADYGSANMILLAAAESRGYIPVQQRDDLYRFHLISTFGNRNSLGRCIRSLQGQIYGNYTCTLIDDCCDGFDPVPLIRKYKLDNGKFRYMRNRKKLFMLSGPEYALDILDANPADIIVTLDGDDWFAHPHVLWQLNAIYRLGRTRATYGNSFEFTSWDTRNFQEFSHWHMTTRWNCAQNNPDGKIPPVRQLSPEETRDGWACVPWCHFHTRSCFYAEWLVFGRETMTYGNGKKVHSPSDQAIFVPIFDNCEGHELKFINEPSYVYQHVKNTSEFSTNHNTNEHKATRTMVTHRDNSRRYSYQLIRHITENSLKINKCIMKKDYDIVIDTIESKYCPSTREHHRTPSQKSAIVTMSAFGEIVDAIFLLNNYMRNCTFGCVGYIFVPEYNTNIELMLQGSAIIPIFLTSLKYQIEKLNCLQHKFANTPEQLRRSLIPIVVLELLDMGYSSVLFIASNHYVVANIDDIHLIGTRHPFVAYPYFNNSNETAASASTTGRNDILNENLFSCTMKGRNILEEWYNLNISRPFPQAETPDSFFDDLILESEGVYINKDQGIGYNALYNQRQPEGVIAPTQKSYMLSCGRYARVWLVDGLLMRAIANNKMPAVIGSRPTVAIYCLSLLFAELLAAIKIKSLGMDAKLEDLGLRARFDTLAQVTSPIAQAAQLTSIKSFWEKVWRPRVVDPLASLNMWADLFQKSICHENSEVFAKMIKQMFPKLDTFAIIEKLRQEDLRYLTENILASEQLSEGDKYLMLEHTQGGEIVGKQLQRLKACHIHY